MSKNAVSMLPLPKFKGEQEKFGLYDMQIKAYLLVKRMSRVLEKKLCKKLPARKNAVLEPSKPDEKAHMVALEKNIIAMAILMNFFMTKGLLSKFMMQSAMIGQVGLYKRCMRHW